MTLEFFAYGVLIGIALLGADRIIPQVPGRGSLQSAVVILLFMALISRVDFGSPVSPLPAGAVIGALTVLSPVLVLRFWRKRTASP